jgi:death-on-curing protein
MVSIAMNHPFVDGNKRTGYVAGFAFLRLNGYHLTQPDPTDPQLAVWLEEVVTHALAFEIFVERLRERLES